MMAVANVTMVFGNHVPLSAMARTDGVVRKREPEPDAGRQAGDHSCRLREAQQLGHAAAILR